MKSPGLKPIEAQNARNSSACVPYLATMCQKWSVANSVWGEPDCSVAIKNALAIERRGGRGGGGTAMLVRPVGRDQRPWNKGLLIGQKKPLEPKHVWSIRVRLEIARSWRNLVIFNLAIDSKLRACDLVKLRLDDICSGARVRHRATIVQKKTGRPVQFEITEQSRGSVEAWLPMLRTTGSRYLFPSRLHARPHISTRQYARLVHRWVESIGLGRPLMARTRCGARRLPRSIVRLATCALCNSSSAIRSWRAPSDISGLRWMTL
jgi:integrase